MRHYTRKPRKRQVWGARAWRSLVIGGWAVAVQMGVGGGFGLERGWATGPEEGVVLEVPGRPRRERSSRRRDGGWRQIWEGLCRGCWEQGKEYVGRTGPVLVLRSGVLWMVWEWGGERAPGWLVAGALGRWFLVGLGEVWPGLWGWREYRWGVQGGEWFYRGCLWGLVGMWGVESWVGGAGVGGAGVEVEQEADGSYRIRLRGPLEMRVEGGADKFWLRLVMLFLRELEGEEERRGSRATREGRRPLVRQQQIAAWFGVKQPHLSRWEKYRQQGDWRRLQSQRWGEVLTGEVQQAVVGVWVRHPGWGARRVRDYLQEQGVKVTWRQVQQVAEESGWGKVREELGKRWVFGGEGLRPREEWLEEGLLGQMQRLVERLEAVGGLTEEERVGVAAWVEEAAEVGLEARGGTGEWFPCGEQGVEGGGPKEKEGRARDLAPGGPQLVKGSSFRPKEKEGPAREGEGLEDPGVGPQRGSRWEMRERAIGLYVRLGSRYRPVARVVGVEASTVYRWVRGWGQGLIPMGAWLGVVRSSGVVGVDEKYVLVPKNNKRGGKKKRWMYVYLAVDVYTYDLLHIAIYPYCTRASAKAFLLALRAKGYHPAVVVTDLREDYGPVLGEVFPQAEHHECIFHAEQAVGRILRQVYGKDYGEQHPEAESLRQEMGRIFRARTKRTAQRRYEKVMGKREKRVREEPPVEAVFDLLEKHWPKLVNAIESRRIPRTNNAVEQVISRLDQYYQNYRGLESITTAEVFLGVFEKVYRLTPFTEDTRPEVRGKCPLELAGYDVSRLPWTRVCRAGPELLEGGSGP